MEDKEHFQRSFIDPLVEVLEKADELRSSLIREGTASRVHHEWPPVKKALGQVRIEAAKEWSSHEADLSVVGLTDLEHNWKLEEFLEAAKRWGDQKDRRSLHSVLGWALLILGSLGNAFPLLRNVIDFIKEFLEGWKQGVQDALAEGT